MKILPAIDLMNGKVVRLYKGDPEKSKFYHHLGSPVEVAKKWEAEGADALHIIDLDAAFNRGSNFTTILKIINSVNLPVQVGGGIRSLETAEKLLKGGAHHIILGTVAFREPELLESIVAKFRNRIIIALDHLNGKVRVEGWKTDTRVDVEEAIITFLKKGITTFLLTSIGKDGTLRGVDVEVLKKTSAYREVKIIAAGGVGSLRDLVVLRDIGVYGVVIGKALYEGAFTLKEALKIARGEGLCLQNA